MLDRELKAIVVFDIDGVIRDVAQSYRRAIADTVEEFTDGQYRSSMTDIDNLKAEGIWNNDWEASRELVYRYFAGRGRARSEINLDFDVLVSFFQSRYRGQQADFSDGYISREPLLLTPAYLQELTNNGIAWGFFSGATRISAEYVLKQRLGLNEIVLAAMEDAPSKPDPTGLFMVVEALTDKQKLDCPIVYVGDTVADMYTILEARKAKPERCWLGVGILPPHIVTDSQQRENYTQKLQEAGGAIVLANVEELTVETINLLFLSDV
jgi:HAD superfamily phosphatase